MAKKVKLEPVKETKPMPKNELIKLTEKKDSEAILVNGVKIYPVYHKPEEVGMIVDRDKNPLTKAPYEFMRYADKLVDKKCNIYIFVINGHTQFLYLFGEAEVKEIKACSWGGPRKDGVYIINNTKVNELDIETGQYGLLDYKGITVNSLILSDSILVTELNNSNYKSRHRGFRNKDKVLSKLCLRSSHITDSTINSKAVYFTKSDASKVNINVDEIRASGTRLRNSTITANKCDFNNTEINKFEFNGYNLNVTVHDNTLTGTFPSMYGDHKPINAYQKGDISLLTPLLGNSLFLLYRTSGEEYVLTSPFGKDVTGDDLYDFEAIAKKLNVSDFVAKDLVSSVKKRIELVKLIKDLGLSSRVNIVPWHEESDIF